MFVFWTKRDYSREAGFGFDAQIELSFTALTSSPPASCFFPKRASSPWFIQKESTAQAAGWRPGFRPFGKAAASTGALEPSPEFPFIAFARFSSVNGLIPNSRLSMSSRLTQHSNIGIRALDG